jgi:hypothetical protein
VFLPVEAVDALEAVLPQAVGALFARGSSFAGLETNVGKGARRGGKNWKVKKTELGAAVYTCDFPYESPYNSVYDLRPKVSSKLVFEFFGRNV